MKRVALPLALAALALPESACLPDPAPRAVIDVDVRGGPRDRMTDDGYVLHMERRLIVVGVGTSSTTSNYSTGSASLRNLDAEPFSLPSIRARDERFVVVTTTSYFEHTPSGPGIGPDDVDLVDGDVVATNARSGVSSFAISGSLTKDGRTWTLSWRSSMFETVLCARLGANGFGPVVFESGSHATIDVVVNLEYALAASGRILGQLFVNADTNDDGVIDRDELVHARLTSDSRGAVPLFTVTLDGEELACRPAGTVSQAF